ncbi:DUF3083 family protein [Litorilituus lipolyticus]|uniref:DUF3083 family protein n=1 Tax=Litorilituus lipolyticus TaxID=2491017 RepID=A0A502KPN4_9GAMM|nr:DUF3083 family protein [Litorilituus lipolyticus]TPH13476.1 DUF3083 family protein [Litorilituus lipolyticus]
MSIIRKRSAAHKAYLPNNLRDNQYILAEFKLSDELLLALSPVISESSPQPYYATYQKLSKLFFDITEELELKNCQFIANDKLARVRFSQEMHQWQTNQQILFYYNPEHHQLNKAFFDATKRAKKISLLFLATGSDIRLNAAYFHQKVAQVVAKLCKQINLDIAEVRLRDHQHLTYDLFAKNKGCHNTQTHKLRHIEKRYQSQEVSIPIHHSAMNYAVVSLNVSNELMQLVEIDQSARDPYNPLYAHITNIFTQAAQHYNLNNAALIANGLVPIVRYSIHEIVSRVGELQMLGYNPEQLPCGIVSKWDANELTDTVHLIFVATKENSTEHGFGRFLNQIEQAMKEVSEALHISASKDEVLVRFHQHIAYNF